MICAEVPLRKGFLLDREETEGAGFRSEDVADRSDWLFWILWAGVVDPVWIGAVKEVPGPVSSAG